jgi:hypothetical protein
MRKRFGLKYNASYRRFLENNATKIIDSNYKISQCKASCHRKPSTHVEDYLDNLYAQQQRGYRC